MKGEGLERGILARGVRGCNMGRGGCEEVAVPPFQNGKSADVHRFAQKVREVGERDEASSSGFNVPGLSGEIQEGFRTG